jgi:hypothetical protein
MLNLLQNLLPSASSAACLLMSWKNFCGESETITGMQGRQRHNCSSSIQQLICWKSRSNSSFVFYGIISSAINHLFSNAFVICIQGVFYPSTRYFSKHPTCKVRCHGVRTFHRILMPWDLAKDYKSTSQLLEKTVKHNPSCSCHLDLFKKCETFIGIPGRAIIPAHVHSFFFCVRSSERSCILLRLCAM